MEAWRMPLMEDLMYGDCVFCKRFAPLNRYKICSACSTQDEKLLQDALEYLKQEGKKSIVILAEHLMVKPDIVFLWIEQNRIPIYYLEHICPRCGEDLLNGLCSCQMDRLMAPQPEPPGKTTESAVDSRKFYSNLRVAKKCLAYWDRESKIHRRQKRDIWLASKSQD